MDNANSKSPTRIYVPAWMGISILVGFFVMAVISGLLLYKFYAPQKLLLPGQLNESLGSLGQVKISPGASTDEAVAAVMQKVASETSGKLTIIFFYDGYDTQADALTQVKVMEESLNEVEPFKSLKDLITYKVFTTEGKKCHVDGKPSALVCDPKLIESFQKLGVDHFKVVLMSPEFFTPIAPVSRGANSFITLSTFNNTLSPQDEKRWVGIVFTHLLGNSLGLKDEIGDIEKAKTAEAPPEGVIVKKLASGKPNCAPDLPTAQKWWGGYISKFPDVGFNLGCSNNLSSYYPEKNTLMSDLPKKQSYGAVSTDYLRGVLSCFYGGKDAIVFPAGFSSNNSPELKSCDAFRKEYPSFWEE